jgi:sporulation protein YlmC with PRC-barrel domain
MSSETATYVGRKVVDPNGNKVGKVSDIFSDTRSLEPKWASVNLGITHPKDALVPLQDTFVADSGQLVVPFDAKVIKRAPTSNGVTPTAEEEAELVRYYGLPEHQ